MAIATSLLIILTASSFSRADMLIGRLGGPGYAARERVGHELVKLGRYSLPALRRGQKHTDLEIAERCKRLLPYAEEEAVRQRVAHILAVPPLPPPDDLPRLKRFLSVTGDTREARELYVEMFVAHVRVLEDVEWAGDKAGEVFWKAIDSRFNPPDDDLALVVQVEKTPRPRTVVSRASVALFLLLSADPKLKSHPCESVGRIEFPVLTSEAAKEAVGGPKGSPAMQNLLFAWLAGPRNIESAGGEANRVKEAFRLMTNTNLKAGRPVALKIALDDNQWHLARAAAMIALMNLGKAEDVQLLSALVTNSTVLGMRYEKTCELGDVALAACAKLSNQSLSEYGLGSHSGPFDMVHAEALDYGFTDAIRRTKGREKWAEWASRNLTAGGKP